MAGNEPRIPPRPQDPFFSAIWDMTYGPARNLNPLSQLAAKVDSLKVDLRALITLADSIDRVDKGIERASTRIMAVADRLDRTEKLLREATLTLKESNVVLSETNKTIRELLEQFRK